MYWNGLVRIGAEKMKKYMDKLYDNLDETKAFASSFTNFAYFYDDMSSWDFHTEICNVCKKTYQSYDYLAPRASCKKPTSILHSLEFGVSEEVRNDLIEKFDITEEDFRPVRNKRGEIVYYQITPQHVMLPIHEENEWPQMDPCPCCGSIQYGFHDYRNEKNEFYYYISQAALDDMHDLNVSYEQFRFYMPMYIISRRLYDYLTELFPRTHYRPFYLKALE